MLRVECPNCGARLRGPDEAAGKKIRCPKCGHSVILPGPDEPPGTRAVEDRPPDDAFDLDQPALPRLQPRPEPVSDPEPVKKAKKKAKKKKVSGEDDDLSGTDMVLCLLCPGIACIASVVYMIQGKGKGIKIFGLSILASVIWNVIRFFVSSSMNQPGP